MKQCAGGRLQFEPLAGCPGALRFFDALEQHCPHRGTREGFGENAQDIQATLVAGPCRSLQHAATHPAGDDDLGRALAQGEFREHLVSVDIRHDQIERNMRGLPFLERGEELPGHAVESRFETGDFGHEFDHVADAHIVFQNQHTSVVNQGLPHEARAVR